MKDGSVPAGWDGVVSGRTPRVASAQPEEAQPPAAHDAMHADRFGRVIRTGRVKPAGAGEERRQQNLVAAQYAEGQADGQARPIREVRTDGAAPKWRHTR